MTLGVDESRAAAGDGWRRVLARRIALTDLLILVASALVAMVWRFGFGNDIEAQGPVGVNYQTLGAAISIVWWIALTLGGTRDPRILGDGPEEYARVARISFVTLGLVATISLVFKWDMSRGYLAIAFPLGTLALLVGRKVWRVVLRNARADGRSQSRILVVGRPKSAQRIADNFAPGSGYEVVGVWSPGQTDRDSLEVHGARVPVTGGGTDLAELAHAVTADGVVVADTEHLGADGLRDLAWSLHDAGIELMVSPNLVDIAGQRMHLRPIGNEPFLHLEAPQYGQAGSWPKRTFDVLGSGLTLLLASPVLLVTTLAVKATSRGPVLYRQERIGRDGERFSMLKFRSMRVDADAELAAMMTAEHGGDVALFKVSDDPRVTRVGRFIRRYSIDELPQLVNVLRGDMSLVGPRPQREHEVALYDHVAHRRLTVRPGMTGLWQVSGRSDLTWEDAIRLDTYYVENWSMAADAIILSRTVRAVLASRGAY